MAELFIHIILGTMLLFCGLQDLRKKKVVLWMILLGAILILLCLFLTDSFSVTESMGGALVGLTVVMISKVTGGKIGMGDGFILCVTGLALGFWSNLEVFAIALFVAAIFSIILLIFRLADRNKSIPFVPFLLFGFLLHTFLPLS